MAQEVPGRVIVNDEGACVPTVVEKRDLLRPERLHPLVGQLRDEHHSVHIGPQVIGRRRGDGAGRSAVLGAYLQLRLRGRIGGHDVVDVPADVDALACSYLSIHEGRAQVLKHTHCR